MKMVKGNAAMYTIAAGTCLHSIPEVNLSGQWANYVQEKSTMLDQGELNQVVSDNVDYLPSNPIDTCLHHSAMRVVITLDCTHDFYETNDLTGWGITDYQHPDVRTPQEEWIHETCMSNVIGGDLLKDPDAGNQLYIQEGGVVIDLPDEYMPDDEYQAAYTGVVNMAYSLCENGLDPTLFLSEDDSCYEVSEDGKLREVVDKPTTSTRNFI